MAFNSNISLSHHFFEFRLRLSYLIFSLLLCFITCYSCYFEIIYIFTKPFLYYVKHFIFTDVTEFFYTSVEISFFLSVYMVIPLFLYEFWCFFLPSLFKSQRKKFNLTFFYIFCFFIFSVVFVYFMLLPILYKFLVNFQISTNLVNIELQTRIKSYIKLVCKIFIFCSFFFQLPLIFMYFIQLQYIKLNTLAKNRLKIFFIILIFSSFFSPPDIFTQLCISLFFILFLEFLFILGFFFRKISNN